MNKTPGFQTARPESQGGTPTHLLILQESGETEDYTPPHIVAARQAMGGGIDLDPASCEAANTIEKAAKFFTKADNGLEQRWEGRVWLNWPYSREGNRAWVKKLVFKYEQGHIAQGCCISYSSTSESWFAPLLQMPQCFLYARTRFIGSDGQIQPAPTKGSVVTYFGSNVGAFATAFAGLQSQSDLPHKRHLFGSPKNIRSETCRPPP